MTMIRDARAQAARGWTSQDMGLAHRRTTVEEYWEACDEQQYSVAITIMMIMAFLLPQLFYGPFWTSHQTYFVETTGGEGSCWSMDQGMGVIATNLEAKSARFAKSQIQKRQQALKGNYARTKAKSNAIPPKVGPPSQPGQCSPSSTLLPTAALNSHRAILRRQGLDGTNSLLIVVCRVQHRTAQDRTGRCSSVSLLPSQPWRALLLVALHYFVLGAH